MIVTSPVAATRSPVFATALLASCLVRAGAPMGTPREPEGKPAPGEKPPMEICVAIRVGKPGPDGKPRPRITVDKAPIDDWDHLRMTLRLMADERGARKRPAIVAPSADAQYVWAWRALGVLSQAGFQNINFKHGEPGRGKLDAPPNGKGEPQARPLPPRRDDNNSIVVTRGGANAKPVPRIVINGVRMLVWDHVSRSVQHLAGPAPEVRGKVAVKIQCPADVPFGWVHGCVASCVEAGIWHLSFAEPMSQMTGNRPSSSSALRTNASWKRSSLRLAVL